jgi:hypothetical protein
MTSVARWTSTSGMALNTGADPPPLTCLLAAEIREPSGLNATAFSARL